MPPAMARLNRWTNDAPDISNQHRPRRAPNWLRHRLARAYGDLALVNVTGATLIVVATTDPQGTIDALHPSITIDNVRWINVSRNE